MLTESPTSNTSSDDDNKRVDFSQQSVKRSLSDLTKEPHKNMPVNNDTGISTYFIKYYLLMNAAENAGPPIFIPFYKMNQCQDNSIDVHKTNTLSITTIV